MYNQWAAHLPCKQNARTSSPCLSFERRGSTITCKNQCLNSAPFGPAFQSSVCFASFTFNQYWYRHLIFDTVSQHPFDRWQSPLGECLTCWRKGPMSIGPKTRSLCDVSSAASACPRLSVAGFLARPAGISVFIGLWQCRQQPLGQVVSRAPGIF